MDAVDLIDATVKAFRRNQPLPLAVVEWLLTGLLEHVETGVSVDQKV